ncbi:hypothetical protein O3M35_005808 [Rhynocoris fuscipes]|uniref:RING-type domain-containing protein n=1 Tax=Rhynocoris fuscipes TaxID=488301 RepID=A0AAW1DPY0_9HEMI
MSSNVSSTVAAGNAPATRSNTTRARRPGISAAGSLSSPTNRNTRSSTVVARGATQATAARRVSARPSVTAGTARGATQASGSRVSTTRTAATTAAAGRSSTLAGRSTTQASGSRSCTTRRTVRPTMTSVTATRSVTVASASPATRRTARSATGTGLIVLHERSPVASPRGTSGDGATGSRGRCTRNVHVDKEVQTENRNEVSVSLNALKRRRQSLSPTTLPCPVCFNEMHPIAGRAIISLKCGHIFCKECIETITSCDVNKFCPLCLEPVQKRHFRKIYFC